MRKCFFINCKKPVNERGKFCEEHDRKEQKAKEELEKIFDKMELV